MKKLTLLLFFLSVYSFGQSELAFGQCKWKKIAEGNRGFHTLALNTDGTLWSWGNNTYGSLGDGTTISKDYPILISTDITWSKIAAGNGFSLALKSDGTLWYWGKIYNLMSFTPVQIGSETNWVEISSGLGSVLLLKDDMTLWSFGKNINGELGNNTTTPSNSPIYVGANFSKISAGYYHNLAIKNNGTLWEWGKPPGASGPNILVPTQVRSANDWSEIATGTDFNLALKTNKKLYAWGSNQYGALGNGNSDNFYTSTPVLIDALSEWTKIAAGGFHSIGKKIDNTVWVWGRNIFGALGNGNNINQSVPVALPIQNNSSDFAGANFSSYFIKSSQIYATGMNDLGQLGTANTINYNVPIQIGCGPTLSVTGDEKLKISVYPNPVKDELFIKNAKNINRVTIYDTVGRVMIKSNTDSTILNVSNLSKGIYFIEIIMGDQIFKTRFIKE